MSFFDDSHVTDVGMEGSIGPSVGAGEMISQGYRQQYRVDSALALEKEIEDRWLESLRLLEENSGGKFNRPVDPRTYKGYAELISGVPITVLAEGRLPRETFDEQMTMMRQADNAIKALNNPEVQSFEQILQEVVRMQHQVEQETSSMSERTGVMGTLGSIIGAMGGSFSERDPLNVLSLGFGGGGRTIAMKVATEMGIAGTITAATEVSQVQPNREFAGLPERSMLQDVLVAMGGAGLIRGGLEGIGAGVRSTRQFQEWAALRELEELQLNDRDVQMEALFATMPQSPRARAGLSALDDIQFVERNNPYGVGDTANARFLAELQDVQRVLGGAPMTAIARALPPVPFEAIEKEVDFEIVKEMSPQVWARLEEAQARVVELDTQIADTVSRVETMSLPDAVRLVDEEAGAQLDALAVRVNDEALPEPERAAADLEANAIIQRVGPERVAKRLEEEANRSRINVRRLRASRRSANRQYREAYKATEKEAEQIRRFQAATKSAAQRETVDLLGNVMGGRTFIGSALTHEMVERQMTRVAELAETQDERAVALFREREDFGEAVEGETKPLAYETADGRIDIGLAEPVDPTFRILTEDGEFSVREIMDDLKEDERLDEAMRSCLL